MYMSKLKRNRSGFLALIIVLFFALNLLLPILSDMPIVLAETSLGNLVLNPSFEDGIDSPEVWKKLLGDENSYHWDEVDGYEGDKSIKLTLSKSPDRVLVEQSGIKIKSNTTYKFTFYAKTDSEVYRAGFGKVISIKEDGTMFPLDQQPPEIRLTIEARAGWTKYEQIFTPVDGTVTAKIQLQMQNGIGSVWYDSISLEEVDAISPQNATYTKNSEEQLDINVSISGSTLNGLTYNGQLLNNGADYDILENSVTLKKEFLESLPAGNNIIFFNMSSGTNLEFNVEVIDKPLTKVNLVQNPGFEDGTDSPEKWQFINTNQGSYLWDEVEKNEGNKSLKLIAPSTTDRAIIQQASIPIKNNASYKLSFYVKTDLRPDASKAFGKITWFDKTTGKEMTSRQYDIIYATNASSSDWIKYEKIFVAPEEAATARIQLQILQGEGKAWFDSVRLEEYIITDNISPQNDTFNKNPEAESDLMVLLTPTSGSTLNGLTYNGQVLQQGLDYDTSGDFIILRKEFLASLPVGKAIIFLNMSSGTNLEFNVEIIDNPITDSNLVQNPSFEIGNDFPEQWQIINDSTQDGGWLWDESAKQGDRSVKLIDKTVIAQKLIPIRERYAYQFSAFYKTEEMEGTPSLRIKWYASTETGEPISVTIVDGLKQPSDWAKLYTEEIAPIDAKFASLYLEVNGGIGKAWFDQITLTPSNMIYNHNFEDGSTTPYYWDLKSSESGDAVWSENETGKFIKLTSTEEGEGCALISPNLPVMAEKFYFLRILYKTSGTAIPSLNLVWYDRIGETLRTDNIKGTPSSEWKKISILELAPRKAEWASVQVDLAQGTGTVLLDDAEFRQTLVSNVSDYYYDDYKLIPVTDVEDFDEKMTAEEFWDKIPAKEIGEKPEGTVWTQDTIRNFFFGPYLDLNCTEHPLYVSETVDARDETVPHVTSEKLGQVVDNTLSPPPLNLVIADDIVGRPFLKQHSGHSNKYYPRRTADHLIREYYPSYILTEDEKYKERAKELLSFLEYSQYKEDGSNEFIQKYYPDEGKHPEWAGGWDFLFDWNWKDAGGYIWQLHEPDHHVSASFAMSLYHAYEFIEKDPKYLEQARSFIYNIVPHYGLHKGVYKNHTYYWSEYGSTGKSEGNPTNDAIDNVQALIGTAIAMAGYYETDPIMKAKFLELARGMMWYLVREYETDGRFYYYGSENKTLTMPISHDRTTLIPMHISLAYLYKAGVDISDILEGISTSNENYYKNWSFLQSRSKMNVFKLYDGEPKANEPLKFTSFVQVTNANLKDLRFIDTISADDFVVPERLDLRISKILSPTAAQNNWTVDEQNDFVLSVTPEQLQQGVDLPFDVSLYDVFKISYEVTAKDTFDRQNAKDIDSELLAWEKDEQGIARYIHVSSGLTPFGNNKANTMPLRLSLKLNSENFLSYTSRLLFPIEGQQPLLVEPTTVPTISVYEPKAYWGIFEAEQYVYPVQSLLPFKSKVGTGSLVEEMYSDKGKTYSAPNAGDSVTFEFEVFLPEQEFQVLSSYSAFNGGGKQILRIDGEQQGEVYNTLGGYSNWYRPVTTGKDQGTKILSKGKHTVTIEAAEAGKTLSIYDAITLRPVSAPVIKVSIYGENDIDTITEDDGKLQMIATIEPDNAANKELIWSVEDGTGSAFINETGLLTAVTNGKVTVKATSKWNASVFGTKVITISGQIDAPDNEEQPGGDNPTTIYYNIAAESSSGGSISPSSANVVKNGSVTFNITPDDGYKIFDVLVNNKSVGAVTNYTFTNVTADGEISAVFVKDTNVNIVKENPNIVGNIDINTLVPYYVKDGKQIIASFSAMIDDLMHYSAESGIKYFFKDNTKNFTDISGHWAENDISFVSARELFQGTSKDNFSPDISMTRGMFATVIGRLCGADTDSFSNSTFTDVSADAWYASYIEWAAKNGIVSGYGNGEFGPEDKITREQMATIIVRLADLLNFKLADERESITFDDNNEISSWAISAVSQMQKTGVIFGKPNNIFDPKGSATRAEVAAVLKRLIAYIVK